MRPASSVPSEQARSKPTRSFRDRSTNYFRFSFNCEKCEDTHHARPTFLWWHRASRIPRVAAVSILGTVVASSQELKERTDSAQRGTLGVPGPYPGRVIEIRNLALKRRDGGNRAAVRESLNRGLVALTGADDSVEAWRIFVKPGEAVGIKVVPNGYPEAHTSPELVLEVTDGLRSAGIRWRGYRVAGPWSASARRSWRAAQEMDSAGRPSCR